MVDEEDEMMAWIQIGLFDRADGKGEEIIAVFREWGRTKQGNVETIFEEFVEKVRAGIPSPEGVFDVYITFYPNQESFVLPKSFIDLIHETGWEVNFLLNTR